MSVIELNHRLTSDPNLFEKYHKSSDSLVYVGDGKILFDDGQACLYLTVGEGWFDCVHNSYYAIPDAGLNLKPRESCVIETRQIIGVPQNVFGLVTGKGEYIFRGIQVASGKIAPGFHGRLKIGIYNGGQQTARFKKDEPFCSSCFFDLQSNFQAAGRWGDLTPRGVLPSLPRMEKLFTFLRREWGWLATILLALASFIISLRKK